MKSIDVVCAVICAGNLVYFCKRNKNGILKNKWEFPGGKIEEGEDQKEALKREIMEELNTSIIIDEYLGEFSYDYTDLGEDNFHINLYAYVCTVEHGMLERKEHSEGHFMKINRLYELDYCAADLQIIDAVKEYFSRKVQVKK